MSKYLISTSEIYRIDSENEAKKAIEEAKKDKNFILTKYVNEYKERKQKGEVIDSYYKLTLTKVFNDIKEPASLVNINYEVDSLFTPQEEDEYDDNEF